MTNQDLNRANRIAAEIRELKSYLKEYFSKRPNKIKICSRYNVSHELVCEDITKEERELVDKLISIKKNRLLDEIKSLEKELEAI